MAGDQGTELRSPVELPSIWWRTLRESLRILAAVLTRMYLTENEVARRLRVFFGDRADPAVSEWTAAHADLHWANLIGPGLIILDWVIPALCDHSDVATYRARRLPRPCRRRCTATPNASCSGNELYAARWLWDRSKERDQWSETNPGA
ncbi:MAG: hypothetical protein ACRDSZ_19565 [Pseudonocardiaceae bacterium]